MALTPGTRLGPYEVLSAIGAGGMGEVYQARDTRLDRLVALKVLASSLTSDPQSRERFEREARAISSLNHPNICVLHDVGHADPSPGSGQAVDYLVMEYLDGETLAARLVRGQGRPSRGTSVAVRDAQSNEPAGASPVSPNALPPMAVAEALSIAIPIASALDRAHRQGIVHRDLKPGNVMLTKGTVKLLDFGLARLTRTGATFGAETVGGTGAVVSLADLSMPTLGSPLTMKGVILGTLQYMSPEQIEGKDIDARTDIFAFGAVLYEMLTGRRPFEGKSQASLIGAILDHDPPRVMSLLHMTPPMLDELVARCLAKDPDERWQSARDMMRQLEWVVTRSAAPDASVGQLKAPPRSRRHQILRLGSALAAGAAIAAAAVAWALWPKASVPPVVTRFTVALPEGQAFTRTGRHVLALSPDGTRLVYVANQQLYLRLMRELTAAPISGTENTDPSEPIFSPDGQWVAFWSGNLLKKVPITGGTPVTLSAAANPLGASWAGGRILLGQLDPLGIIAVPANGGAPTSLLTVDAKTAEQAYGPQLIGGGRAVLFTLRTGDTAWDDAVIVVQDLKTSRRTVLVNGGTDAHLLPTGHLVYSHDGTLFAVPFDETRLEITGGPVPVQQGIGGATGGPGATQVAWSVSGALAFVLAGPSSYGDRTLIWLDRHGKEERANAPHRQYGFQYEAAPVNVSPDGTRVALAIVPDTVRSSPAVRQSSAAGPDIWVLDIVRGTLTRLTFTGAAIDPMWTRDSQRVCYVSRGANRAALCQAADGTGQPQALLAALGLVAVSGFSLDGSRALATITTGKTGTDIMITTPGPPSEMRPLIATPYDESYGAVSPDGRWLAYQSNESGRFEIYVRPFPDVEKGRWQVSTDGAVEPRWSSDGRELFFLNGFSGTTPVRSLSVPTPPVLMSVGVQAGASFVASAQTVVVRWPLAAGSAYDVARDGRFIVNLPALSAATEAMGRPQMVVVQHWFDELKARVPTK